MSHMIPIVSSSPPPFDDSYGCDDGEDDDFGNFTGADDDHSTLPNLHVVALSSDKTQNNDVVNKNVTRSTPQKILCDSPVDVAGHYQNDFNQNLNEDSNELTNAVSGNADNVTNGNSNFAQFDIEDVDLHVSTPVRPHIVGLPLGKTSELEEITELQFIEDDTVSSESATLQESKEHNKNCNVNMRDSTTDSGMFSNDISPVQKSEDTAEFCDKTSSADSDEPFPDLPPDGKVELASSHSDDQIVCSDHLQVDADGSPTSDSKIESDGVDNENRTNSFDAVNEDCDVVSCSLEGCDKVDAGAAAVNETSIPSIIESDESRLSPTSERDSDFPLTSKINFESDLENDGDSIVESCKPSSVDDTDRTDNESLNDVDHPNENHVSDCKPVSTCDDVDVIDIAQHSVKTSCTKDHKNSTDEQIIPSDTDLSQDTHTFQHIDANLENKFELTSDSSSENQESVGPASDVSTDISAQNTDPVQNHSNEGLSIAAVGDDTDITTDTNHCQSTCNLSENQWNSENKNASAKPSSNSCVVESGDNADSSFDEFATFGISNENDDDGDDDDWASFQSIHDTDQPLDLPSISQEADNDDDDFGDFIDNVVVKNDNVENSVVVASSPHTVETFSGMDDGDGEDEEWANFEEPQGDGGFSQPESRIIPEATTVQHKVIGEKLSGVLSGCFQTPSVEHSDEKSVTPSILDVVISCDVSQQSNRNPGLESFTKRIWGQLIDLDKTPALVYHWSSSTGNSYMFKTLCIDTQNILLGHKKQSVPIFASNMGLLEPIRGPVDSKKEPIKTEPALVDPSKVDIPINENQSCGTTEKDIPPVEFDWHNSGLTNPLAAKTLDLDFLTEQESESAGKSSVFQSEMLDTHRTSVKSLPPLEDVLKNMKLTTTTKTKKTENLNPEARRIIDSLPLLSFMHAKVLMFPFRQQDN
ncbi:serine-aspartate repeat-containing protein F-like isoform X3 [Gigantopelta aegis]|uniref:serine-aspartate repeat-containing protein F-like isoform X3 n=1 Tax=Gigantopelta aegis TaxID=1735272 RepID=UPI001B888D43|nr:serine-aspartate repeat-containing protein F-like isoform X3 [Gigantopelta aegis]